MQIALERATGRSGPPVYRQIADRIREHIVDGQLRPGERLPTIRELARRLSVNRDTVSLAYEELAAEGSVETTVGRGTFVAAPVPLGDAPGLEPRLSPLAERLLEFQRARPRFGSGTNAIPMHALIPDPTHYPADEFRRALNRVLAREGADLLLYGGAQGHLGLREALAARLRAAGLDVEPARMLLCHGASQGIALGLRLFAEPGDVVAIEEPTYNNVLAAVSGLGLRTAPIPMRENGLDLVALERALERDDVKALYTIPTFHNPMGTTTSPAHRRALLDIATRCNKPVLEDGFEMDLHLSGRPVPPLAALDRSGVVVHLFSFSKSLFPGVRVGAISAPGRLVDALVALKQATDLSDAIPLQAALAEFVADGSYDRHLSRMRRVMRGRRDALLAALETHMPPGTRWTRPDGGYQVWVELPEPVDTGELLADALAAGVLFAPGSQFQHDARPSRCLRLSFAMADERELARGVEALAGLVRSRAGVEPRGDRVCI